MIARFQALLPYELQRPSGADLIAWETTVEGYAVKIYPPVQAIVSPEDLSGSAQTPLFTAMEGVRPNPEPQTTEFVTVGDEPTIVANLIVIDFSRDSFDRAAGKGVQDPPFALAFDVANDVLSRMRFLMRAAHFRPLLPERTPARIDYLNDDGTPVGRAPDLARSSVQAAFTMNVAVLDNAGWIEAGRLPPDFEPPAWDSLLLDAFELLPRIEGSIAPAFAALEAFIDWALDEFARGRALDPEFYRWIANRDEIAKRPSATEQFDVLLRFMSGHSLKEDERLWRLFAELRRARNSLLHEGRAMIGNQPLDVAKAAELVNGSREIIDWIELLLPEAKRRQKLSAMPQVSITKYLTRPDESTAPSGEPPPEGLESPPGGP